MARTLNGSTQWLTYSGAYETMPFSVSCWVYQTTDKLVCPWSIKQSSVTVYHGIFLLDSGNGSFLRAQTDGGGAGQGEASTSTTWSTSTWHHVLAVFASATDRRIYLDGGGKGTNADNHAPSGCNETQIGTYDSRADRAVVGRVAEVGVYNVALSDNDAASLASGISPLLMRPDALVQYWPFLQDDGDVDHWGQYDLTPVATPTYGDHAPIIYPSGVHRIVVPGAVAAFPFQHYRQGGYL